MKIEDPKVFKNLQTYEKLAQIILKNEIERNSNVPHLVRKKETILLAHDFFIKNDIKYDEMLTRLLNEKKILFKKRSLNSFIRKNGTINIDYTKTIDDLLALVHEISHYIHRDESDNSISNLFKEVFPYTDELRCCEDLKTVWELSDLNRQINNNICYNYNLAKNSRLELELYKVYKEQGKIDYETLNLELYNYYVRERLFYQKVSIDIFGKYLFGNIISAYINQKLKSKDISKVEYKFLRENINNLSLIDVSKLLDIDFNLDNDGLYISDSDIKKLSKTYKLEVDDYNE